MIRPSASDQRAVGPSRMTSRAPAPLRLLPWGRAPRSCLAVRGGCTPARCVAGFDHRRHPPRRAVPLPPSGPTGRMELLPGLDRAAVAPITAAHTAATRSTKVSSVKRQKRRVCNRWRLHTRLGIAGGATSATTMLSTLRPRPCLNWTAPRRGEQAWSSPTRGAVALRRLHRGWKWGAALAQDDLAAALTSVRRSA